MFELTNYTILYKTDILIAGCFFFSKGCVLGGVVGLCFLFGLKECYLQKPNLHGRSPFLHKNINT